MLTVIFFLGCRDFHLSLVHNDRIFSSDFGAHIVGKDGQPRQVHLDKREFYHGYLHGEGTKHYTFNNYMHTQTLMLIKSGESPLKVSGDRRGGLSLK